MGGRIGNLVAGGYAAGCRGINHGLIAVTVGIELVVGQRRDDDAWRGLVGRCTSRVDEVLHGAELSSLLGKRLDALFLQCIHNLCFHVITATAEIVAPVFRALMS